MNERRFGFSTRIWLIAWLFTLAVAFVPVFQPHVSLRDCYNAPSRHLLKLHSFLHVGEKRPDRKGPKMWLGPLPSAVLARSTPPGVYLMKFRPVLNPSPTLKILFHRRKLPPPGRGDPDLPSL